METLIFIGIAWTFLTGIAYICLRQITFIEWIAGVGISILAPAFVLLFSRATITTIDVETWSGHVTGATHTPSWVSLESRTVTDFNGNFRTQQYYRTHSPTWTVHTTVGDYTIDYETYHSLKEKLGKEESFHSSRPKYVNGNQNDYRLHNINNWHEPVVALRTFKNRIRAAQRTDKKVPPGATVHAWPRHQGFSPSGRLLGTATAIDALAFDRMCARLGPEKRVNIIMIGYGPQSTRADALLQEAAWNGGKKNDLVLCYGPNWSYVFGWTASVTVKRALENLLLEHPRDTTILPLIEKEVQAHYIPKDWSEFDDAQIPVPAWGYGAAIVLLLLSQVLFYIWAHQNDIVTAETSS